MKRFFMAELVGFCFTWLGLRGHQIYSNKLFMMELYQKQSLNYTNYTTQSLEELQKRIVQAFHYSLIEIIRKAVTSLGLRV